MKLTELMKKNGVQQQELAEVLNVSRSSVYKYQQGKAEPNIETLIKIADFFNTSLDALCEHPRPYDLPSTATPEQRMLVDLVLQLNPMGVLKATSYCAGLLANQN